MHIRVDEIKVLDEIVEDIVPIPPLPDDPNVAQGDVGAEVDMLEPKGPEIEARSKGEVGEVAGDITDGAQSVEGNNVHIEASADGGDDGDSSSGSDYGPLITMWEANGLPIPPDEQRRIDGHEVSNAAREGREKAKTGAQRQ